jgi:hypothetical protein
MIGTILPYIPEIATAENILAVTTIDHAGTFPLA